MASIYKRRDRWRAEVFVNRKRVSKTFSTKRQAQLWANEQELEFEKIGNGEVVPGKTMADAFDRYAREVSVTKKGARWEILRLELFAKYDLAKLKIADLRTGDLAIWRDLRLSEGKKPATVKRELYLISSMLSIARREWHWLDHEPMRDLVRPKDSKPRDRRLSENEISRLLQALHWEEDEPIITSQQLVAGYMLLALETAMRLGEICNVTKNDIDLEERRIIPRDTKNSDTRDVPLSKRALSISIKIFSSKREITSDVASALFRRAVKKAGIENLTFHDTRHEAITRLAKKLGVLDLARMVGHRDPRSLMIYYNATASEIAARLD